GFTTDVTIQADEDYSIEKVLLGETLLTAKEGTSGVYTLTVEKDCTLAITTKSNIASAVNVMQNDAESIIAIYDMTGKRVDVPTQAGIYIVRTMSGAKKVVLQ
ncbi:MAG: hypothetical protein ACI4UO_04815, partial [Paludibacteraceae bacterium]